MSEMSGALENFCLFAWLILVGFKALQYSTCPTAPKIHLKVQMAQRITVVSNTRWSECTLLTCLYDCELLAHLVAFYDI